jgi:hypothetical protein
VTRDAPCRIASAHQSEDILLKFAARAAGYVFGWCGTYEPLERPLASETTQSGGTPQHGFAARLKQQTQLSVFRGYCARSVMVTLIDRGRGQRE